MKVSNNMFLAHVPGNEEESYNIHARGYARVTDEAYRAAKKGDYVELYTPVGATDFEGPQSVKFDGRRFIGYLRPQIH